MSSDLVQELRKWLRGLSDADLGLLVNVSDILRGVAQMPGLCTDPRPPVRRELRAVRAQLAKALAVQLATLADDVLGRGVRVLRSELGFSQQQIGSPDLATLEDMLLSLGRPLGELAFYGLAIGDYPATELALENRSELQRAMLSAPRSSVQRWLAANTCADHDTRRSEAPVDSHSSVGRALGAAEEAELLVELQALLSSLCELADRTAVEIRAIAESVARGAEIDSFDENILSEYRNERDFFIGRLGDVEGEVESSDFAKIDQWVKSRLLQLEEKIRKQQEVDFRAIELQEQAQNLRGMIETFPESGRPPLREALIILEKQYEELTGEKLEESLTLEARVPALAEDQVVAVDERPAALADEGDVQGQVSVSLAEPQGVEIELAAETRNGEAWEEARSESAVVEIAEMEHGFPWEEGDPPIVVQLTRGGRLVEGYWVTVSSGEASRRAAALRFAAAAYSVHNYTDATAVLASVDLNAQELSDDNDAALLVMTATLRAGLIAGWGHSLLEQIKSGLTLSSPWKDLIDLSISVVRRGIRVDEEVGVSPPVDNTDVAKAEVGRKARNLLDELPRRKTIYQRATRVQQRLMLSGQPLAAALDVVVKWSEGSVPPAALSTTLHELSLPDASETMIEAADAAMRTPKQAREPIMASALQSLFRAIDEVRTVVREADVLSRRLTAIDGEDHLVTGELSRVLAECASVEAPPGVEGAALSLFRDWLRAPTKVNCLGYSSQESDNALSSFGEPSDDVLLSLPDLPRGDDGRPDAADSRTMSVLARLVEPLDLEHAVRQYCKAGDIHRATRVVTLMEEGLWPEAEAPDPAVLRLSVEEATALWSERHRSALRDARDLFARIRTQNLLAPADETAVALRLESLAVVGDGKFAKAENGLAVLVVELESKRQDRIGELDLELNRLNIAEPDHSRIRSLLDDGDTITAAEFLAFLRAGTPLPKQDEQFDEDIKLFASMVSRAERRSEQWRSAVFWTKLALEGEELTPLGESGVQAWDSLAVKNELTSNRIINTIRDVLRVLGVSVTSKPSEVEPGKRVGCRRFRVQGTPTDDSYIASLGSAASSYNVLVVTEENRGQSVLKFLKSSDMGRANVLLYLHPLDLAARRALAADASREALQALVVDTTVLGWVAAKSPGSWRATQRVTLPWTAMNPYTPFVAGLVPPEVFFGRDKEMAEVVDPRGGLFIYGGRQLGKSALLRRVEATFNDGDYQHAVYLDLKGRGIGEAEPASHIWRELVIELKGRGVLQAKVSQDAPVSVVVSLIKEWLSHNGGRRLLLLADEADAFLGADSRGFTPPGEVAHHFPNVLRLKELMESTDRRFKVVFAGLHQVQRFSHLSNVPLVHGGPDILVGPLEPADAKQLVLTPMSALGYRFEQPELVWRLLSATNYQASLIQIFCEDLVRTLHSRGPQGRSLPVLVRESDVEAVAGSDRVRARIAEKLRITTNLEDRYRVLTLVIVLMSLRDSFNTDYAPDELLEEARKHWPAGFENLNVSQVSICLDEMVGLGLLIRLAGQNRYAVRSPNVVNMLGTKASLERELAETDFDLAYSYDPRDARRLLLRLEGLERRSPLTDGQLSELLTDPPGGDPMLSVITGTDALGLDRVYDALKNYAEMRASRVERHETDADIARAITNAKRSRSKRAVIVADLRSSTVAESEQIGERLARERITSVLLVKPLDANQVAETLDTEVVRLERWTASSIRSWHECPFEAILARTRLIEATGGWPDLVEQAIYSVVAKGATQVQALARVRQRMTEPDWARQFLERAGLDEQLLRSIALWAEYLEPGELVSPADIAAMLETDLGAVDRLLNELTNFGLLDQTANGIALDRVVHQCTAAAHRQS